MGEGLEDELQLLKDANANLTWLQQHYPNVSNEHNNQFIAIHKQKLVAWDSSMDRLVSKLKKMNISVQFSLIKFVTDVPRIL